MTAYNRVAIELSYYSRKSLCNRQSQQRRLIPICLAAQGVERNVGGGVYFLWLATVMLATMCVCACVSMSMCALGGVCVCLHLIYCCVCLYMFDSYSSNAAECRQDRCKIAANVKLVLPFFFFFFSSYFLQAFMVGCSTIVVILHSIVAKTHSR